MSHYRERLNFTKESIQQAQNTLNGLRDFVAKLNESRDTDISDLSVVETLIESTKKDFTEALEDDLSMPKALSSIFNLKNEVNKLFIQGVNASDSKKLLDFIFEIDKVLGLNLEKPEIKDERINKLFDKYILAKMNKDYAISDKIREELSELGWIAEDHQGASRLRKK
jgi:cysteinyl-tRNA synthetase